MSRDLAAEHQADLDRAELEALRELRDTLLGAYDVNGELLQRRSMVAFDDEGHGPARVFSIDLVIQLTRLANKAVRR